MEELKPRTSQEAEDADTLEKLIPEIEDSMTLYAYQRAALHDAVDALRRAAPANEALTLDELRKMDGEPVWIVEAPDWGHWELSEHAEDYLDDRDPDFYGMKHDDPAGRYGLHVLGWLAYARRPEAGKEANL